jgi:hypothetical protein
LKKSSFLYVLFTFLFPALISSLQLPLSEKSKEQEIKEKAALLREV